VRAASRRALPINIGTEMNRAGLPFRDDLDGPVLREFREAFLQGARIMVGHAIMHRYAGSPYGGEWSVAEFKTDLARRNAFYASVGALPPLPHEPARRLEEAGEERARSLICDSAAAGRWVS
jgi:hypothetical protein